jgi:hypothetical protein
MHGRKKFGRWRGLSLLFLLTISTGMLFLCTITISLSDSMLQDEEFMRNECTMEMSNIFAVQSLIRYSRNCIATYVAANVALFFIYNGVFPIEIKLFDTVGLLAVLNMMYQKLVTYEN